MLVQIICLNTDKDLKIESQRSSTEKSVLKKWYVREEVLNGKAVFDRNWSVLFSVKG